jgi:hypothetical protein
MIMIEITSGLRMIGDFIHGGADHTNGLSLEELFMWGSFVVEMEDLMDDDNKLIGTALLDLIQKYLTK